MIWRNILLRSILNDFLFLINLQVGLSFTWVDLLFLMNIQVLLSICIVVLRGLVIILIFGFLILNALCLILYECIAYSFTLILIGVFILGVQLLNRILLLSFTCQRRWYKLLGYIHISIECSTGIIIFNYSRKSWGFLLLWQSLGTHSLFLYNFLITFLAAKRFPWAVLILLKFGYQVIAFIVYVL